MHFEILVRSCLYNWLGYGNLNGYVWFIGTEEGGAEIWRQKTRTLEESLRLRSKFSLAMDFRNVWEDKYGIPLQTFKGATVWRYIAAFLLALKGQEINTDAIKNFVFVKRLLGTLDSDHFLCELLPLPKRKKGSIGDYKCIWKSISSYHNDVIQNRLSLISDIIIANPGIELIVSFERLLTQKIIGRKFRIELLQKWTFRKEEYRLFRVFLPEGRTILFLATPFFGQGQISYQGLKQTADKVKLQCPPNRTFRLN